VNEVVVREAKKLGADDTVSLNVLSNEQMVRFANNSLTVAKRITETGLLVYLTKNKSRVVGASSNPEESIVKSFVQKLFKSLKGLPAEPNYSPLPSKRRKYGPSAGFDPKIGDVEKEISGFAKESIDAASEAGAARSAGAIEASLASCYLMTSTGIEGYDKRSKILLNIRSFLDHESSGHGLSCSSGLAGFKPGEAGRRAGEDAKKMSNPKPPAQGEYQVLMSPTVASNLIALVGEFSSAFSVDAGTSYLAGKLGKRVASSAFTLKDHGWIRGGLGGRRFDDEGSPTQSTTIIDRGVLKNYLHNLTTAKKFKKKSTGNAGWIDPNPWNLEVSPGDSTFDELVKEMRKGIILTSNWYTRFTNYRTGEFSTVPRDGAYLVENGQVKGALNGLRVSDTLERMFSSVQSMSKSREWIEWWEVSTPTLCPWVLVDGVKVTRAYG
jgi:PmbA protein